MAERRMFAKSVIFNDHFGNLPLQAQLLYFNLSLEGDDDGFLNNAWFVQRMIGATADDMQALIDGGYLIRFDSGVVAIRHWRVNNSIKSDRYKPTMYQAERALLTLKNGTYEWNTPAPPKPAEKNDAPKCSPVQNDDDLLPSAAQPANASPYRPAQAEDCPAYHPVRNDDDPPYDALPMADNSPYRPAQAEDAALLNTLGIAPGARTVAACLEDEAVGAVSLQQLDENTGAIVSLGLLPAYRGQGLAAQLLGYAVSAFRKDGLSKLTLLRTPEGDSAHFFDRFSLRTNGSVSLIPRIR